MKLLFDQNLSPRLPHLLADVYAGSVHVRQAGLLHAEVPPYGILQSSTALRSFQRILIFRRGACYTAARPSSSGCASGIARFNPSKT
jgi:hypothetical protein